MKKWLVLVLFLFILLPSSANANADECCKYNDYSSYSCGGSLGYCKSNFADDNHTHSGYVEKSLFGLDADTLDGKHASNFLTVWDASNFLTVDDYDEFASYDHKHLNMGVSTDYTSALYVNDNAGEVGNKDIRKNSIKPAKIYGTAWTKRNDGPGSGLNADTLDGYHVKKLLDEIASLKARVAALEAN